MHHGIGDEKVVLDGRMLRLSFVSADKFTTAELWDGNGSTVRAAPVLSIGGRRTSSFDLSELPAGEQFEISLRMSDGQYCRFGDQIVRLWQIAEQTTSTAKRANRKLAAASFRRDSASMHASVYVDAAVGALRLRISDADDIDAFIAKGAAGASTTDRASAGSLAKAARKAADRIRFSIVSAVYNVEKYLDDYFSSLTSQTLDFASHFEVIMVDDGSTDRSAKLIKRWQRKFPQNIRYIHKQNGGVASARNAGLAGASHEWITFIDSDDLVDRAYFAQVAATIGQTADASLSLISCNRLFYNDETKTTADTHPLAFRFAAGRMVVPVADLGRFVQLHVNCAFFRKSIIKAQELRFDERIRPSFEDTHFVGRYLLGAPDTRVVLEPGAKYFYRRRADRTSLQDSAPTDPESYGDELRYGFLDLLRRAAGDDGRVPLFIQNAVLYGLSWPLHRVVGRPHAVAFLDEERKRAYRDLLQQIFSYISDEAIWEYDLTPLPSSYRIGILSAFKRTDPPEQTIHAVEFDAGGEMIKLVHWSGESVSPASYRIDGREVVPAFGKARRVDFVDRPFVWEHIAWLPAAGGGKLTATAAGRRASIALAGQRYDTGAPLAQIKAALSAPRLEAGRMSEIVRSLRSRSRQPQVVEAFRDAWLFMDRDSAADDNAEHLYRHVRARAPDLNAFFILQRGSPDWARLEADGFRLLPFNETDHALALLNATHLISSQADHYVLDYLPHRYFGDMLRRKFIFLQHGIIRDDISAWLNSLPIDCMICSTASEFGSVVADGSPYRFSRKEVVLTGLPRHDVLLEGRGKDARTIVVMPTWRESLTGLALGPGNVRSTKHDFYRSEFATRWKSLLHSPRLAATAEQAGVRVVFVPHPNMEQYLDFFAPPPSVAVRRFGDGESMQPLFRELSLFVTDFSSKAFDVAYLDKPVIYYQFDAEQFFGGGHVSAPGYFDYQRDGFGPVVGDEESLLDAIQTSVAAGPIADPMFRRRAADTFIFRDGRCRERVFAAILALDRPRAETAAGRQDATSSV